MAVQAAQNQPGLLALPSELRLQIYDILFEPMVKEPEHHDSFMLPAEWPKLSTQKSELRTYTSVISTCKAIRDEAKDHFEDHFMPRLTLYFDNVPALHSFCSTVAVLDLTYWNIKFSLRSNYYAFHTLSEYEDESQTEPEASTGELTSLATESDTSCPIRASTASRAAPVASKVRALMRVLRGPFR